MHILGASNTIRNELIQCIHYIDYQVNNEINDLLFFSVQADDIMDINHTFHCLFIIRFINFEGALVEIFLVFLDMSEDRISENLY